MATKSLKVATESEVTDLSYARKTTKKSCLALFAELFLSLFRDKTDRALRTIMVEAYPAYCKACKALGEEPDSVYDWIVHRAHRLENLATACCEMDRDHNFSKKEMSEFFGQEGLQIGIFRASGELWDKPIKMRKGFAHFDRYLKQRLPNRNAEGIAEFILTLSDTEVKVSSDAETVSV